MSKFQAGELKVGPENEQVSVPIFCFVSLPCHSWLAKVPKIKSLESD